MKVNRCGKLLFVFARYHWDCAANERSNQCFSMSKLWAVNCEYFSLERARVKIQIEVLSKLCVWMVVTPNIEPFIIQCAHLLLFVLAPDSILNDGKIDVIENEYFFPRHLSIHLSTSLSLTPIDFICPVIDEFIPLFMSAGFVCATGQTGYASAPASVTAPMQMTVIWSSTSFTWISFWSARWLWAESLHCEYHRFCQWAKKKSEKKNSSAKLWLGTIGVYVIFYALYFSWQCFVAKQLSNLA